MHYPQQTSPDAPLWPKGGGGVRGFMFYQFMCMFSSRWWCCSSLKCSFPRVYHLTLLYVHLSNFKLQGPPSIIWWKWHPGYYWHGNSRGQAVKEQGKTWWSKWEGVLQRRCTYSKCYIFIHRWYRYNDPNSALDFDVHGSTSWCAKEGTVILNFCGSCFAMFYCFFWHVLSSYSTWL